MLSCDCDKHFRVEYKIIRKTHKGNCRQKFAGICAITGVRFRKVCLEREILYARKKSISKIPPPNHTLFARILPDKAGAQHHIRLIFYYRFNYFRNVARVILKIRMNHNDDIGASLERFRIACFLISAVPFVFFMDNND
ncbi:hypothetical protein A2837_00125 [Candidatus Kaiserbacteria bacterium RIFCSPHIGHO2_01_FULL_46_22]|uniref:Uncharacterized protein n=1 Tax=Candidatus Kaiserbacteria bacterium RIFCSPHIGHO2_01_FULL_46_22 TaxID=1798475 RepID=A0A1F6BXQ9_9BACT|nr:MAG: hypothetical protein A2837_00125 [Candidatus Kaiserbacteria bacterium RIFCSPHIGHO2_01_FULL_46_22]